MCAMPRCIRPSLREDNARRTPPFGVLEGLCRRGSSLRPEPVISRTRARTNVEVGTDRTNSFLFQDANPPDQHLPPPSSGSAESAGRHLMYGSRSMSVRVLDVCIDSPTYL